MQVLLRLQAVLDGMQQADEDDELVFITRMVQLACSARAQLREGRFGFPAASSTLLKKLYPTLMVASLADAATYDGACLLQHSESSLICLDFRAQLWEGGFGFPAASATLLKKLYPILMVASLADAATYDGTAATSAVPV